MPDPIKKLHTHFSANPKNNLGSIEDFRSNMSDEAKRRKFFEHFSSNPKNKFGTFEEFSSKLFPQKKSPSGSVSDAGSSTQKNAPAAEPKSKEIGGDGFPVMEANWETGQVAVKEIPEIPVVPEVGTENADQLNTVLTIDVESGDVDIKQPTQKDISTIEKRRALKSVRESRKGDYQSDAVERMERGMTDVEKASLARKTPLEAMLYDTDVTSKQYKAQSKALASDQQKLSMGMDAIDEEVMAEFGDTAFEQYRQEVEDYQMLYEEYKNAQASNSGFSQDKADRLNQLSESIKGFEENPLIQERNQMIGAMNKNLERYQSMQKDDRYQGVMAMVGDQQEIQKLADEGGTSRVNTIVVTRLANMAAGIGRLSDTVEKSIGTDKEYGKLDVVQDFLIDLSSDAQFMWPTPSQYSRQLLTSTAKWGEYEVDFDRDKVSAVRKDGKVVDMNLTDEQEAEIMALERESQWNLEAAPYQAASTVADMAVMLAGAGKIKNGLTAIGVGENVAAKTGVALSVAGQMSNDLYAQGLEIFKDAENPEQKASQFALIGGLSIGMASNIFSLEARMLGAKPVPKMNVSAVAGMTPKEAAKFYVKTALKEGAGETIEEAIIEPALLALDAHLLGGEAKMPTLEETVSTGVLSFAVGALFGGGSVDMNALRTSSLLAASENPTLFGQELRKAIDNGTIQGDEEFIARQVSRATRIGAELNKLDPDIKISKRLEAVALMDKKLQLEQRLDEVKGNEGLEIKYQAQIDEVNAQMEPLFDLPTVVEKGVEKESTEDGKIGIGEPAADKEGKSSEVQTAGDLASEITSDVEITKSPAKEKLSKLKYRTIEDDIATAFSEGVRLKTSDYDSAGDPNTRQGNVVALKYLSKDGEKIDQWAQELAERHGIDEQEAQQRIIDFINDNPKGYGEYANRRAEEEAAIETRAVEMAEEAVTSLTEEEADELEAFLEGYTDENGEVDMERLEADFEEAETGFNPDLMDLSQKVYQKLKEYVETQETEKPRTEDVQETPFGEEVAGQIYGNESGIAKTGGLLTDTLSAIGIKVPDSAMAWLKKFYKKTFTSKGLLNSSIFDRDVKRRSAINAAMKRTSFKSRELKRQLKKEFPKGTPDNILKAVNDILAGKYTSENISGEVKGIVREMRAMVDALSGELVTSGLTSGNLTAIVLENMESYLTRSYKVHDDPDFISKIKDTSVWSRAKSFMGTEIQNRIDELTEKATATRSEEARGRYNDEIASLNDTLANLDAYLTSMLMEQQEKTNPNQQGQGGTRVGSKNLGIFKKRKDIPKPLRELFGEYEDPIINFTKSIFKMTNLLENQKFLEDVRRAGEGVFLFNEPRDGFEAKIAAEKSSTMSPLNGMYTSPELKEGFEKHGAPDEVPSWIYPVVWLASKAKYAKTILSPVTHVRNFMFNMAFHWANGHTGTTGWKDAWNMVKSDISGGKMEAEFARLVELGVVYDSSTMGEMMALLEETRNGYDRMFEETNLAKRIVIPVTKAVEKAYQAEDDFHKIVAFSVEKSRYADAWYGKPFSELEISEKIEVEEYAAKIVRDTLPTYSMVSENMKRLRRIPVTGTFVSFPYEVLRVTANTLSLAREEYLDPRTRSIGIRRGLGFTSMMTGFVALSKAMHLMAGLDDDDKVRDALPPWSSDSLILPIEKNGANLTYVDVTSILPQGYIVEVLNTLFDERKGAGARFATMLHRLSEPYIGLDMTYKRLNEVINGRTETGREITSVDRGPLGMATDSFGYLSDIFTPGLVTTGERLYRSITEEEVNGYKKLNPKYEVMALFPGVRVSTTNFEDSFKYKAYAFRDRRNYALSLYRRPLKYSLDKEEVEAGRQKAYGAYSNMFKEMRRVYFNMIELGADPKVLKNLLGGFNKDEKKYLFRDETPPIEILEPKK